MLSYSKNFVNVITIIVIIIVIFIFILIKNITFNNVNLIVENTVVKEKNDLKSSTNYNNKLNSDYYNFYKYYYDYLSEYMNKYTDVREGIPKMIIPKIALAMDITDDIRYSSIYNIKNKYIIWLETNLSNINKLTIGDYIIYVEDNRVYLYEVIDISKTDNQENINCENDKIVLLKKYDDKSIIIIQAVKRGG